MTPEECKRRRGPEREGEAERRLGELHAPPLDLGAFLIKVTRDLNIVRAVQGLSPVAGPAPIQEEGAGRDEAMGSGGAQQIQDVTNVTQTPGAIIEGGTPGPGVAGGAMTTNKMAAATKPQADSRKVVYKKKEEKSEGDDKKSGRDKTERAKEEAESKKAEKDKAKEKETISRRTSESPVGRTRGGRGRPRTDARWGGSRWGRSPVGKRGAGSRNGQVERNDGRLRSAVVIPEREKRRDSSHRSRSRERRSRRTPGGGNRQGRSQGRRSPSDRRGGNNHGNARGRSPHRARSWERGGYKSRSSPPHRHSTPDRRAGRTPTKSGSARTPEMSKKGKGKTSKKPQEPEETMSEGSGPTASEGTDEPTEFVCHLCKNEGVRKYWFSRGDGLRRHMTMHSKVQLGYQCPACEHRQPIFRKADMRNHIRVEHGGAEEANAWRPGKAEWLEMTTVGQKTSTRSTPSQSPAESAEGAGGIPLDNPCQSTPGQASSHLTTPDCELGEEEGRECEISTETIERMLQGTGEMAVLSNEELNRLLKQAQGTPGSPARGRKRDRPEAGGSGEKEEENHQRVTQGGGHDTPGTGGKDMQTTKGGGRYTGRRGGSCRPDEPDGSHARKGAAGSDGRGKRAAGHETVMSTPWVAGGDP